MKKVQIDQIENTLSVRLPEWYVGALEKYPFPGHDVALFWDAGGIVKANSKLRSGGWNGKDWPAGYLVIGEDGCGRFYFINLHADDRRIYVADRSDGLEPGPDTLGRMISSATLDEHVAEQIGLMEESSDY